MSNEPQRANEAKASIAPMLSVRNGARAIEFYKAAFGARDLEARKQMRITYLLTAPPLG
jgi:hypothetical protein